MSVVFSGFPTKTKPDRHDIAEKYYNLNPNHKKLLDIFIYLQGAEQYVLKKTRNSLKYHLREMCILIRPTQTA
jgi:hypothetical protein